ncbi:MAG TPA: hypothetical protein PLP21_10805 [Pyrinomonadaceae bacterium]|nr:hypothetical protein [Acidobacteriota bacterium]HQZ96797.1 hypothetical protein [Pyrinomonadaceae bacterium]
MKSFLLTLFCFTISVFAVTAQNQSVYTSTKTTACKTIKSSSKDAGSYEGECPGVGGYKIRLIEGDIRQTIDIITPAKKKFELNFWHFYGAFSSIGEKVEWRTKAGVPVALIARYEVADPEGIKKGTSYLMISKISKNESCVTDVVPPGAKQNEKARKLADAAISKPCKSNE